MNRIQKLILTTTLVAISTTSIAADKQLEDAIEARQGFMDMVSFNMSILGAMAKGKRDYDPALAEAAAQNIYSASTMNNSAMWPQGSDNSNPDLKGKTEALPYIWENFAEIGEKHQDWTTASKNLAANAGKSLNDLRKAIGPVGKSCKGCHKVSTDD